MTDYTHKRYLVQDKITGEKRTIVVKIGTSPRSKMKSSEEIAACIGGFRSTKETQ